MDYFVQNLLPPSLKSVTLIFNYRFKCVDRLPPMNTVPSVEYLEMRIYYPPRRWIPVLRRWNAETMKINKIGNEAPYDKSVSDMVVMSSLRSISFVNHGLEDFELFMSHLNAPLLDHIHLIMKAKNVMRDDASFLSRPDIGWAYGLVKSITVENWGIRIAALWKYPSRSFLISLRSLSVFYCAKRPWGVTIWSLLLRLWGILICSFICRD